MPAGALALAYRAHVREARQRSEVDSLLAIMRDVHAAAGTEAAAGVLLEHARLLVGATGAALVLHAADGRVLRAQVDGRERARRSFTGDTTRARARAARGARATSPRSTSPSTAPIAAWACTSLGLPAAIAVALRGDTRIVGLLAVERGESFGAARAAAARGRRRARRQRARERPDGARAGRRDRAQGAARARGAPRSADRARQPLAVLAARRGRRSRATTTRRR